MFFRGLETADSKGLVKENFFQYEDRPKLMKNSHCPIPEFQVVPETEVENLMVRDSERILKESGKPRLNFNPSFTDRVNSTRVSPHGDYNCDHGKKLMWRINSSCTGTHLVHLVTFQKCQS